MAQEKKDGKRKLWKIPLIVICTLGPIVAWLVFGKQGLLHLYHTELERQAYIERIRQLTEENQALIDEISRLRTDMEYVESFARKQFNMIKSKEVICLGKLRLMCRKIRPRRYICSCKKV